MKSCYIKPVYFSCLFLVSILSRAQVSALYAFSQYTTSGYQSISNGTVFGNTTSDDVVFVNPTVTLGANYGAVGPGLDIGFSFLYNNVRYDRVGVCNDGWITFGHSALGNNAVNTNASNIFSAISSTSTASPDLQNRIAILSRDLQGQSGSVLEVKTIGASPNRSFVVQWTNYRKYNGTGDSYNFQLCLYETINVIEFKYGIFTNGSVTAGAQVGLRGTVNSDYLNRVTNTANPWPSSIAGNANTSAVTINNTGVVPTYGLIYRWTPPQCSGTLSPLSASVNPSFICSNATSSIQLLNSYTLSGITYTWSQSGSAAGPYTLIPNSNDPFYLSAPISSGSWFQAVSTCINNNFTVASVPVNVQVAAPVVNSVPYSEGFEGIILANQLPNCSWMATNIPSVCNTNTASASYNRLPYTGSKFASFKSGTNTNGDYFFTNGIQLNAGATYSASVAFVTDGNNGWNNFSICYNNAQNSNNLVVLDSALYPTNNTYAILSHTFMVSNSGVYYVAIKCIAGTVPFYLSFDDITVTAPCSLNSPTLSVNTNSTIICSGQSAILTAFGANTYTWSNGVTSSTNIVSPTVTTVYTLSGTHLASGCVASITETIQVKNSPSLAIQANTTSICAGDSVQLSVTGAQSYTWSNASTDSMVTMVPAVTASITVYGQNSNGCGAFASKLITVIQPPSVQITSSSPSLLCVGETLTLSANGALNYQWLFSNTTLLSNPIIIKPTVLTTFTIIGSDAASCTNTVYFTQDVSLCEMVNHAESDDMRVNVFPVPAHEELIMECANNYKVVWQLEDALGNKIKCGNIENYRTIVPLFEICNGIYFLKVHFVDKIYIKKIVKF